MPAPMIGPRMVYLVFLNLFTVDSADIVFFLFKVGGLSPRSASAFGPNFWPQLTKKEIGLQYKSGERLIEPVNDLKMGVNYPLFWSFFQAKMDLNDNLEE